MRLFERQPFRDDPGIVAVFKLARVRLAVIGRKQSTVDLHQRDYALRVSATSASLTRLKRNRFNQKIADQTRSTAMATTVLAHKIVAISPTPTNAMGKFWVA